MKKIIILIILINLSSCIRDKSFNEWNYSETLDYIKRINEDDFQNTLYSECKELYRHNLNLNIFAFDFPIDSFEIVVVSQYQVLYKGYELKNIKSSTLVSCKDSFSPDLEQIGVIILDHKKQKAFYFQEKETYISSELSDEIIFLHSDGSLKLVHNNWFWNTFF